jgi:hypothetical protein
MTKAIQIGIWIVYPRSLERRMQIQLKIFRSSDEIASADRQRTASQEGVHSGEEDREKLHRVLTTNGRMASLSSGDPGKLEHWPKLSFVSGIEFLASTHRTNGSFKSRGKVVVNCSWVTASEWKGTPIEPIKKRHTDCTVYIWNPLRRTRIEYNAM